MNWRTVVVSNPAKLSIKNKQLVINQDQKYLVPLEDVSLILLETNQVSISGGVLMSCGENGVGIISCGKSNLPTGVFLPFLSHSRAPLVISRQVNMSKSFKKRLWQIIIKRKIENQIDCLNLCNINSNNLIPYIARVKSGDKENIEAQVARKYFQKLFNPWFKRREECFVNSCLNYGYSIIRAGIGRCLVKYGFIPAIGIHHHSELNAFNLADDFLEPFRPFVDQLTWEIFAEEKQVFDKDTRLSLVNLLYAKCDVSKQKMSIHDAIERTVKAFSTATVEGSFELCEFPVFVKEK
jgi:CRISPR-associated protein Cas1